MPIYEYRCAACGHQQEFLQKVSDAPLTICTKCGAPEFSKMVTAAGFQLKGSGWYATDFRNSGSKKPAAKKDEGAKGDSGATPSSDAKAEGAKADAKPDGAKADSNAKPATT
jgi:putative FmdB family regulatory protein